MSVARSQIASATQRPDGIAAIDGPSDEEQALIQGLRRGDPEAFRRAVATYTPRLLALSRRIVGAESAEDVVQEVWIAVCRSVGDFENRSALSTWLYRIATNKALNMLRARSKLPVMDQTMSGEDVDIDWYGEDGRWKTPFPDSALPSPEDSLSAEELKECLDKHIDLLPPLQRTAVILRDIEAQSHGEICNVLELTESNLRVLLHRGRMRLMKMIRQYQEDGTC